MSALRKTGSVRVLYVGSSSPCGRAFGSQLRAKNILDILHRFTNVSLVLVSVKDYEPSILQKTAEHYDLKATFRLVPRRLGWRDRISVQVDPSNLYTHSFRFSDADRARFLALAEGYDLIWFYGVRNPNALEIQRLKQATVLDTEDLLSLYHASAAKKGNFLHRLMERRRSRLWAKREQRFLDRFSALCVCSDDDKKYLGASEQIHVVPNGFESVTNPVVHESPKVPTIGFVGLLTYEPNREGLIWFLEKVWPLVLKKVPTARCRIAGQGSTELAGAFGEQVERIGWLEDLAREMAMWSLTIVPVHVGGGTRVKIATAFSHKCPVVSTTLGAYGYDLVSGREILLADRAEDFADACVKLLLNPSLGAAQAETALVAFNQKWSWDAIAPRVAAVVESARRRNDLEPR